MDDQTPKASRAGVADVPDDAPEETATGHALYNRTLGQYVGPVVHGEDKPKREAFPDVPKGHRAVIVRV